MAHFLLNTPEVNLVRLALLSFKEECREKAKDYMMEPQYSEVMDRASRANMLLRRIQQGRLNPDDDGFGEPRKGK